MKKLSFTILAWLLIVSSFSQPNPYRQILNRLHYTKLPGVKDSVLCGTIPVIENREANKGRIIDLYVVLVPAIKKDSLLPPIFDIEGGPGISDTKNVFFYADRTNPYRQRHDIVLVDVRGTGKSNSLYCPLLQDRVTWDEKFDDMYPIEKVKQCYEELSKHADLTKYTTTNVVKDYEDVRKSLGYNKIDLFSLSYGGRVALTYMKMFPASIDKCILWSPANTNARMPLYHAAYAQNSFELLVKDCKQDSLCNANFANFEKEFYWLKQHSPFSIDIKDCVGSKKKYKVSWDVIETKLRQLMYSPAELRAIPYIVHQLYLGNFDPFVQLYPLNTSKIFSEGFYLCVTCAEDVPFIHPEEIAPFTNETFLGTYRIDQQKQACANWARGNIPKDFLTPVHSTVSTLIFSGGLDPITPPSSIKEIASHLPNSQLVFIPNMSHLFDRLSHIDCFDKIATNFLDQPAGEKLNLSCIEQMKPGPYKIEE
jgi:pimeloyl-ACP methyl ester carboxylesterase